MNSPPLTSGGPAAELSEQELRPPLPDGLSRRAILLTVNHPGQLIWADGQAVMIGRRAEVRHDNIEVQQ
jgi:hypothetical protein